MKTKKTKSRKDYKTERGWLNHLWKINKDEILANTPDVDKKIFIARIKEIQDEARIKKGRKVSEEIAVKKLLRTEDYFSKADRLAENALNAIRSKFKDEFKYLRQVTGWKHKIDPQNMRWDSKERMYYYQGPSGKVWIDFSNSPEGVRIINPKDYDIQSR